MKTEIRGTHPYIFRSGQWAELIGIEPYVPDDGSNKERNCYRVKFPDGFEDWWPITDPIAGYEFREAE